MKNNSSKKLSIPKSNGSILFHIPKKENAIKFNIRNVINNINGIPPSSNNLNNDHYYNPTSKGQPRKGTNRSIYNIKYNIINYL